MALWPAAAPRLETSALDLGTREARRALVSGWGPRLGGEPPRLLGAGRDSRLEVFLVTPRALRLEVRAASSGAGGPTALEVEVNGAAVGTLPLAAELAEAALALPPQALRSGANRLAFRYRGGDGEDPGSRVAWDGLRLRPARPGTAAPSADLETGRLRLPLGSEVAYFLELPAASVLRLDGVAAAGGGRLLVAVHEEGDGERLEGTLAPRARPARVPLTPGPGGLVRLSLRATGDPDAAGEVTLLRPRVHGDAPAAASGPPADAPDRSDRPNLIVYLIDTLRADRLGVYGSRRGLTPHLDAFAAGAWLFERAFTPAPWTRPAVASLLTGLDPLDHGVVGLEDRLPAAAHTLPERLRAAGYRTAALSTNWHVSAHSGMRQGFEEFLFVPEESSPEAVVARLRRWLDDAPPTPFFLYVHTLDPHAPYEPPEDLRRRFAPGSPADAGSRAGLRRVYAARGAERRRLLAELEPLYDAEVAWADRGFGAFLAELRRRGLYEESLVVALSDHGEALGERGQLGHARDLYCEALAIPLLVKPPRSAGRAPARRVTAPVGIVDLAPTLLAAAGLERSDLPGRDLLASGELDAPQRPLLAHLRYEGREALSVVRGPWKLVLPLTGPRGGVPELYDLRRSSAVCREEDDLAWENPVRAGYLEADLRAAVARARPRWDRERSPADEEALRGLRALGYQ